jgi:hypothetical protein
MIPASYEQQQPPRRMTETQLKSTTQAPHKLSSMPRNNHSSRRACKTSNVERLYIQKNRKDDNMHKGTRGKDNDRKNTHKDDGKKNAKDGLFRDDARRRVPWMVKCQTKDCRKKDVEVREGTRCRGCGELLV